MSRARGLLLLAAALVALGIADWATLSGTEMAETTFDSGIFLRCAGKSPLDAAFYRAVRPPTVPLLYKAVGSDPGRIRVLQSATSVIGWFALGLALASLFRSGVLRAAVLVGTGLFSLSVPINQWDGVLMSESLFLSLLALALALTIACGRELLRTGTLPLLPALLWFAVALLFAGSRDSAAYLLALPWTVAVALLLVRLVRGASRSESAMPASGVALVVAGGLLILALAQVSLRSSERWRTPLVNVILQRIVPDEELAAAWAERYEFPRNPRFERQAGQFAWNRVPGGIQLRKELESDPALSDVEQWLRTRGMAAYQRHLVLDEPLWSSRWALEGLATGVNPKPPIGAGPRENSYSRGAGITPWTEALTAVFFAPVPAPGWVGLGIAAVTLLFLLGRPDLWPPAACVLFLLAGAAAQAFVTWHGDAAEVPRHTLVVGVLYRLAAGLALALAVARLTSRRAENI